MAPLTLLANDCTIQSMAVRQDNTRQRQEQERCELAEVLASDLFQRAPGLSRVLSYTCERYFRGEAQQVTEYDIALEVLGRGQDFDAAQSSAVRVNIHHLRKKLQRYYLSAGTDRPIQIVLPPGQYAPQFVRVQREPAPGVPASGGLRQASLLGLALAILVAAVLFGMFRRPGAPVSVTPPRSAAAARVTPRPPVVETGLDSAIRILCGSSRPRYVDKLGRIWLADRYFSGGDARSIFDPRSIGGLGLRESSGGKDQIPATGLVSHTQEPVVFENWRAGDFRYDIPLAKGVYELRLYFAETWFGEGNLAGGGENSRRMTIAANGRPLLRGFDVIADAGGSNLADVKVFKDVSPAPDGHLHLAFSSMYNTKAILNGIEILPGLPNKMRRIRICTRSVPYYDEHGQMWEPDHYFSGGRTGEGLPVPKDLPDADLYVSQRYGHFTYTIPVPVPGRYKVSLRFMENYFGAGRGGVGSRVFDVFCNGTAVLRNFDILREAGGENRLIVKTFDVTGNAQGKIILSFVPTVSLAALSALEIVEE